MPWPSGPVVVSMPVAWPIFRVARGLRAQLAEVLDLVQRHVLVAQEIQQRIQQHGAVAGGEDEAVAVGPVRIGGVEFQELGEQHGGDVGGTHGQAGMAGIGFLDGIHAEGADGIGHGACLIRRILGHLGEFLASGSSRARDNTRPPRVKLWIVSRFSLAALHFGHVPPMICEIFRRQILLSSQRL